MSNNQNVMFHIIYSSFDKKNMENEKYFYAVNDACLEYQNQLTKGGDLKFCSFFGSEIPCFLSEEELHKKIPFLLGELLKNIRSDQENNNE